MHPALPILGNAPMPVTSSRWAVARKGFRPFFLLAASFAAAVMPLWIACLAGVLDPGRYLGATYWHAHEMVFGFLVAVLAGFLLTAVGNWTQRETVVGLPLLTLAGLWSAGRVVMWFASALPRGIAAAVDLAFLPTLAVATARPLAASGNRRNYVMPALLAVLFFANLAMHLDALGFLPGGRPTGVLVAIDTVTLIVLVIAGRVFPMFTRNATGAPSIRSHRSLDVAALGAMGSLIVLDVFVRDAVATPLLAGATGLLAAARASHWGASRTLRHPLLWVLHLGYAWIPIGLLLRSASAWIAAVPPSAAVHAITVGAMGTLTIGMMSRVTLGHTGRPLRAPRAASGAFVFIALAAVVRVAAPVVGAAHYLAWLIVAGTFWTTAFALYLVAYAPALTSPRADGKPG